jgi:hypothetical protein
MIYVRQSSAFRVLALLASASGVTCLSDGGWERVLSMDFYVRSSIVLPGKDYQNTFFSNSPFFFYRRSILLKKGGTNRKVSKED